MPLTYYSYTRSRLLKLIVALLLVTFVMLAAGCILAPMSSSSPTLPTQIVTAVLPVSATPPPPLPTLTPTPTPLPPTPTPTMTETPLIPGLTASATLAVRTPTAVPTASPTPTATTPAHGITSTIGYSVQGRPLTSYQFGNGPAHLVFIGGMHGGYEWNTILLAYKAIDYFLDHPEALSDTITVHIIPSANPDGQFLITGQAERFASSDVIADTVPGRFNAKGVDLNRNWDCQWAPAAVWRDQQVSGGAQPFSEPESVALRNFLLALEPAAVVFWHSAANGVFGAGCPEVNADSFELARVYGEAAGYPIHERFNAYPVTGDAGDWLTTQGIPSITVELRNHHALDWPQNLAGMLALLDYLSE